MSGPKVTHPAKLDPARKLKRVLLEAAGETVQQRYHGLANLLSSFVHSTFRSDLPRTVEIETISRCNGRCGFCPVNVHADPRAPEVMSMDLVERIANDLAAGGYAGDLALFGNNEPLLDNRIVDICRLLRARLPRAWIYIYTNGSRITAELFRRLFDAGLDEMHINNYNDRLVLNRPIRALLEEIERSPDLQRRASRLTVQIREENAILMNRGGIAPNKIGVETYRYWSRASCGLPFSQMAVRPSGEVSLCCQDAYGKVTLGDLRSESVHEIWNGTRYQELRRTLLRNGRRALPVCQVCDAYILNLPLLRRMAGRLFRSRDRA